jgi:hypothetical protein
MDIEPQLGIIVKMKSIDDLRNECRRIQLEIKQLLLDHYRYDHGLAKQLNVVNKVHSMRDTLAAAQREMRERLGA